jgi:hypothetical protein
LAKTRKRTNWRIPSGVRRFALQGLMKQLAIYLPWKGTALIGIASAETMSIPNLKT